jgi:integrase
MSRPWVVRWAVDGRQRSRTFHTKSEAEGFRSELLLAKRLREPFDPDTAEPARWAPPPPSIQMHHWARRWLAEQWDEWQPRTRASAIEVLVRFVPLVTHGDAEPPPDGLRGYLAQSLRPDATVDDATVHERWLGASVLSLTTLQRDVLAVVDTELGRGLQGGRLSPSTAQRYRKVARACVRRAVELELLDHDPWPPPPRGRSRRKAARISKAIDVRVLPEPSTVRRALAAIPTHQPGSVMYKVMTAVAYFGGLRPSEVLMLRPGALKLPDSGWGAIAVTEADTSLDEPGEPKTGRRTVPIPPELVAILRDWLATHEFEPSDLLFRTRNGKRPAASNWSRAWHRALRAIGHQPLRVYDCRHAAATTWLKAGVPLGEVARRLGHSVETLVSTYVGAMEVDEALGNERIELALGSS